jgi:hypothetical protein
MNLSLLIYLGLNILGLGIILAKHGQQREGKHSFWRAVICWGVELFLLYKAGLFN